MEKGFDSSRYMELQSKKILQRIESFGGKLYLEFGGKLFDDMHAARVLPGFDANAKIKLLQKLRDKCEIIFCVSSGDIEKNKIRADRGITYGMELLRLIDEMHRLKINVNSVVITKFKGQTAAAVYKNRLEARGIKVYLHTLTNGYPTDVDTIVSDEGYGRNPYIETTKPLVVVNAPGPNSGKLATCLCQLYHEYRRGNRAGYAKFETFPVWDLPLKHPVNIAYEAATADINDVVMIDYFHLQAYGVQTVNYNRDIEVFPVVQSILSKLSSDVLQYRSPTDMAVNVAGSCITDDEVCREAARQEVLRRYFRSSCENKIGTVDLSAVKRIELLMGELGLRASDRRVVQPALDKEALSGEPACAMQLRDGSFITGRNTRLMTAPASLVLNALKTLAKLPDRLKLIAPQIVKPITYLKQTILHEKNCKLTLDEVLIALSICAATNEAASMCMDLLGELAECEVHSTRMLLKSDEDALRKIRVNLTCEPRFLTDELFDD